MVAGRLGREPTGPPQAEAPLPNPDGQPAENTGDPLGGPNEIVPFTVQGPEQGVDNATFTVHVEWANPATDWDVYVLDAEGAVVTISAVGPPDTTEDAVLVDPPPGEYRAVLVAYDQVDGQPYDDWTGSVRFAGPRPTTIGERESWTLTCTRADGTQGPAVAVEVDRGEEREVGNVCAEAKR